MKIINVTPGLISIPPNGWGAVEKIIWETHLNLLREGHDSQILYLNEVPADADIVHIHVANLAEEAYQRGIPYYFTMHDHHAYLYGKDSDVYKENLRAMKNAVKAFVPAKYLIEYFDNIPEYFSHGVNTDYFMCDDDSRNIHRLLCVANNGYAYSSTVDRKGFGIAIEAARQLNIPITIAGPSNNKNYFAQNPPSYEKLTILYDLSEQELLTLYKQHTIFIHPSELEAGHPNLTLLEALSCGLPIVGTLESQNNLRGMYVAERNVDEVVTGIKTVISNYKEYSRNARLQAEELSWNSRTKKLLSIYYGNTTMKEILMQHYKNTKPLKLNPKRIVVTHNIDGMYAEVKSGPNTTYDVSFINKKTNEQVYSVQMNNNCWAKANAEYFVDWKVIIKDRNSNFEHVYETDFTGKKVFICFESKSLGDTLAWIPYVEEFRKKHNCKVVCSTFWNDLFKDVYPNVEFVEPGHTAHNLVALYRIGIFYKEGGELDYARHPSNPTSNGLQKIACDILGLDYREIRPLIKQPPLESENSKQISIAIHSTAQSKYWNNPLGWQTLVDWLKGKGYTVKLLSTEHDGYMGNRNPTGVIQHPPSSIEDTIAELRKSKMFIGISSGLSWVSWAAEIPTVLISGFTDKINEMQDCIRISAPEGKCSGCWNRVKFNPGDWNWCPDHKGTVRQFECSREITAEMVISKIEKLLSTPTVQKNYAGPTQIFNMIDVVKNNPNNTLVSTDEDFWNGIYDNNKYGWWGNTSKSGEGSEGRMAEFKKNLVSSIVEKYDIKSILDFGCGDYNWMQKVTGDYQYTGIDIVSSLVDSHNRMYGKHNRRFIYGNTANEYFHTDFIKQYGTTFDIGVLFDILGHQLWSEINTSLDFILNKLDIKYLLVSNEKNSNPYYWKQKITRNESIDIEIHPIMIQNGFKVLERYDNNLVLYQI